MIPSKCVNPCPPNPVTPIPGVEPAPFPGGGGGGAGTIVTANSNTITLAGDGSAGAPLVATLVLNPEGIAEAIQLASTSYGLLAVDDEQMVYRLPAGQDIHFLENFEGSTGTVVPALNANFDVLVDDASVGSIAIVAGAFTFGGDALTVASGSVIKIVSLQELTFDYLSITMLGLVDVNFVDLGA